MKSRLQLFLILAVVAFPYVYYTFFVGGIGTAKPAVVATTAGEEFKDKALRQLLGVNSISATIRSPKDKPYTIYGILKIEDGKAVGWSGLASGGGETRVELAWSKQGDHWYSAFRTSGVFSGATQDDWMAHLRHPAGAENIQGREMGKFQDFTIYACEYSLEGRDGRKHPYVNAGFNIENELQLRKYVLALGARFFATEAEMNKARTEFIDRMRDAAAQQAAQRTDANAGQ